MEDRKERRNEPWLSVPQFGDWDQKGPLPDYSMDFSKIREMRKQNKRDPSRASLGNEEELISSTTRSAKTAHNDDHRDYDQNHSPTLLGCWPATSLSTRLHHEEEEEASPLRGRLATLCMLHGGLLLEEWSDGDDETEALMPNAAVEVEIIIISSDDSDDNDDASGISTVEDE